MLASFKFHHIGYAVHSIEETSLIYKGSGYVATEKIFDPIQNVTICFLRKEGQPTVELLEPVDETSPVVKNLEKNGVSPYHCCYEVPDIDEAIKQLRRMRYIVVSKPAEAVALEGRRVAFLYNRAVGLIELLENS